MPYRESVWDDSEPNYAPGFKRIRDDYLIWRPEKLYLDAGYQIKTIRLDGSVGDGNDLDRARMCRTYTREMLEWYQGVSSGGRKPDTWGWLISRYLHDEYSDIHNVEPVTRTQYMKVLRRIEDGIGDVKIAETDYARLMQWQLAMKAKGRSVSYIKKWFTHWGLALSHGVKLGLEDCRRIKAIRSEMRIQTPAARSSFITREQVNMVVAEADKRGLPHLSLSVLLRFELMLRGIDVYGEWRKSSAEDDGGVQHDGQIWEKGLTWDMFAPNLMSFTKVISKTAKSLPEPYTFDLSDLPNIRRRLEATPIERRLGPVITIPATGMPPKNGVLTRTFKSIISDLKDLPNDLRISDNRSGGITEAKSLVDPYTLRDAAQHTQSSTTDRYVRGRSDAASKVIKLRQGKGE